MRAICPKHAGMIGVASCPDCTIESLRRRVQDKDPIVEATIQHQAGEIMQLKQQLADMRRNYEEKEVDELEALDFVGELRQQLAECERERDEWKTGAIKRDNARHDAIEQLATVTKERDELAALNARMLVEYEARMKERDELVTALEDAQDIASKALRKAWQLGQTYWQQADSEYISHHRKADETQAKFQQLVDETRAALAKLGADKTGENG